ncbi:NAD(P)H azoreductase [Actinomadura rubteroloni]|uniref:NAD(P)H azoreductase n=1 Tax=Actinomadura rubteroloni TaxID=1926885 RepID=A0A2P4UCR5_9ACTN|nr:NAD(P)H-binding protein [Actinomadura rubteroloni]POM22826.1 NAD(P)H azoreductase [Actinomadura rubteroloni]
MTILVTGGRGHVARSLTGKLLDAGEKVRVGTTTPDGFPATDAEVVELDLARPETFAAALDKVTTVFLYARPEGVDELVQAMERSGVEAVTLLSTRSLTFDGADSNPIAQMHAAVEKVLSRSAIPWTFLRAGTFATNTLQWAKSIRSEGLVRAPYPNSHAAAIHEADIADVAVLSLTQDGHARRSYVMSGPVSLTQRQQVEAISQATGREIEFVDIDPDEYRETLKRWGQGQFVDQLLRYLTMWDGKPVPVVDVRKQLTGRPGRGYAQWAIDHAEDFQQRAEKS